MHKPSPVRYPVRVVTTAEVATVSTAPSGVGVKVPKAPKQRSKGLVSHLRKKGPQVAAPQAALSTDGSLPIRELTSSVFLTSEKMKYITSKIPSIKVTNMANSHHHDHPILNWDRQYAEGLAYTYLRTVLKNKGFAHDWIVDIGGNPSRHARTADVNGTFGRKIWSCNPILSPSDVTRALNHDHQPLTCKHIAQQCVCRQPLAYFSVDSLYYLSPKEIALLVRRSSAKMLVAVVHEFEHAYGSFGMGEASYLMTSPSTVRMTVNGNSYAYEHSNLMWMKDTHYNTGWRDLPSLCWTRVGGTTDHSYYMFTLSSVSFKSKENPEVTVAQAVQDAGYYGKCQSSPLNPKVDVSVVGQWISSPSTVIYSFGPFFWISEKTNNNLIVPKRIVSDVAGLVMGKARNHETFKMVLNTVRQKSSRFNLPFELMGRNIFAAVCLGFVRDVEDEASDMHAILRPLHDMMKLHSDALEFNFRNVWTQVKKAVLVGSTAGSAMGFAAVKALGLSYCISAGLPVALAGGLAAAGVFYGLTRNKKMTTVEQFKQSYKEGRTLAPATRNVPIGKPFILPATPPKKTIDQILDTKIDVTSSVVVPDPQAVSKTENFVTVGGVISTVSPPVVPTNDCHSEASAVIERSLKPQIAHSDCYDDKEFDKFEKFVLENVSAIFPNFKPIDDDFTTWNEKFDAGRRKQQQNAFEKVKKGQCDLDKMFLRSGFLKTENLGGKIKDEGIDKLAPRHIQGAQHEFNVQVGPSLYSFSKALRDCWNPQFPLVYASGRSGLELGASFEEMVEDEKVPMGVLESDFAKFDTNVHKRMLLLENKLFKILGVNDHVLELLNKAIETFGLSRFGIRYRVKGTRHSGDPQTSCGNTMLQVLMHLYAVWLVADKSLEEVFREIRIAGLGDDNSSVLPLSYLHKLNKDGFMRKLFLKLGMDVEPKFHTEHAKYKSTFLSGRFYPVVHNGKETTMLAPCIGRVYSKYGYYTNAKIDDVLQYVRGDALGRRHELEAIPFLRYLNSTLLRCTSGVEAKVLRRGHFDGKTTFHETVYISDRVWDMMDIVYGLSSADEKQYKNMLDNVRTLPQIVDFAPLHKAAEIDMELADLEDSDSEIEPQFAEYKLPNMEEKYNNENFQPQEIKIEIRTGVSSPVPPPISTVDGSNLTGYEIFTRDG